MDHVFFSRPADDSPSKTTGHFSKQFTGGVESNPASPSQDQTIFKIVILGEKDSGKTSILHRLCREDFIDTKMITFAIEFTRKILRFDNMKINTCIWDTTRSQTDTNLPSILKGTDGVVMVVDLSDPEAFGYAEKTIPQIEEIVENDVPLLVLGSKSDLPQVDQNLNQKVSKLIENSTRLIAFRSCSAKSGEGVEDSFKLLASFIHQSHQLDPSAHKKTYRDRSSLLKKPQQQDQASLAKTNKCC